MGLLDQRVDIQSVLLDIANTSALRWHYFATHQHCLKMSVLPQLYAIACIVVLTNFANLIDGNGLRMF